MQFWEHLSEIQVSVRFFFFSFLKLADALIPMTFKVAASGVLGVSDTFPVRGWMLVKWRQVVINEVTKTMSKSSPIFSLILLAFMSDSPW